MFQKNGIKFFNYTIFLLNYFIKMDYDDIKGLGAHKKTHVWNRTGLVLDVEETCCIVTQRRWHQKIEMRHLTVVVHAARTSNDIIAGNGMAARKNKTG